MFCIWVSLAHFGSAIMTKLLPCPWIIFQNFLMMEEKVMGKREEEMGGGRLGEGGGREGGWGRGREGRWGRGDGGRGGRGGRVGWWVKIKAHGISFGGSQNFVFFTFFYFSKIMSNNLKHTTYFWERVHWDNTYIAALFVLSGSGLLKSHFADQGPSGLNKARCLGHGGGIHTPYIFSSQLHSELHPGSNMFAEWLLGWFIWQPRKQAEAVSGMMTRLWPQSRLCFLTCTPDTRHYASSSLNRKRVWIGSHIHCIILHSVKSRPAGSRLGACLTNATHGLVWAGAGDRAALPLISEKLH